MKTTDSADRAAELRIWMEQARKVDGAKDALAECETPTAEAERYQPELMACIEAGAYDEAERLCIDVYECPRMSQRDRQEWMARYQMLLAMRAEVVKAECVPHNDEVMERAFTDLRDHHNVLQQVLMDCDKALPGELPLDERIALLAEDRDQLLARVRELQAGAE